MTDTTTLPAPVKRTAKPKPASSAVPKFAVDMVNAQVGRVSEILVAAADTIDDLMKSNGSALPEAAKGLATTTSGKLRDLSERATEEEAGKLLENLQRTAADHPVATASIGAAIGTALGLALSRLGRSSAKSRTTAR
ncbi:MAG: hypothetical protein ABI898_09375 [Sphingomonadales bacterium]